MNVRKLVLPAVIAAVLATPAFAQQQNSPTSGQADAAKSTQSQDSRGKKADASNADASKADSGKAGKKDKAKADPSREPEEEDDR